MIFDTHAHYTSTQFDSHRDELLSSMPQNGVSGIIDCAVDYESALKSLELSKKYPFLYVAAGIHPESITDEASSTNTRFHGDWRSELKAIEQLYEDSRVVAVGESGLDYYWDIPKNEQLALFEAQIKTALSHDLPILIHDREAHADTYALLKKYKPCGIVHCYSGSADDALWLAKQGLYIGIGGVVTFKNSRRLQETVKALPLEKLLLETDCPYMSPEPFRGKENNSSLIKYVAAKIAEIKSTSIDEVLQITEHNARELFKI